MKIELEIDDKYKDTNLHLMWGMVPIARRRWANQYWEVKTDFCSNCGRCCKILGGRKHPFEVVDGKCEYLDSNSFCSLGIWRPFGCSVSDKPVKECTVKWDRV